MAQISQNADGTYAKSYSDTEIMILQQLQIEMDTRKSADDQLLVQIIDLDNRVDALEGERFSLAEIQNAINSNALRIDDAERRITYLEQATVVDAYNKQQIDALMIPWRVEEISKTFETPTMAMFDEANLKDIKTGYVHFHQANINDPYGLQFPANTMRRYSISAYVSLPKQIEFYISYADRCVVLLNGAELATYQEDGGNFNGTQKVLKMNLMSGWNEITFLVANETQQGGLVAYSNLVSVAERLSPLSRMAGRITGEQIQAGTLGEEHFSPNMDIVLKKLHATTTSEPAGVFGDPDTYGAIQIGDGVISKTKGEPMTIHSDLKVMGYIRDKDGNILDGGGGNGLSTADREKLDSIEWWAEVNQNAYSYVKLVDLPASQADPFANVINAILKMDTLRIRGDLGITFGIETVKNESGDDVQQMVIKNSPTEFKSVLFVSKDNQDTFSIDKARGKFQLGRGIVFVYIDGLKQSYSNYYEVDEWTIRLRQKLPAGLNVLIEWQEGSPQFAKETIVSLANIPIASRTEDGLMSRFFVEDLYDHKHTMDQITDLKAFDFIEIDDGVNELQSIEATHTDRKFRLKAGPNIKFEKLNNRLRISSLGPTLKAGTNMEVTGSPEVGYTVTNTQRFEATRGVTIEHIEGINVIKGPMFLEGQGIDFQMIADDTYRVTNNMSLVSVGGIDVIGNAEDGYTLRNTVKIIESGGIEVVGDAVTGFKLRNVMSMEASADGNLIISGSAATGYMLTGRWPSITAGTGIAVDDFGDGKYLVKNMGVTSYNGKTGEVVGVETLNKVAEGRGIRVAFHGNGDYVVHNTGVVELVDDGIGGGIDVFDLGNQIWKVKNTGIIKNVAGPGISVSTNGQGESTIGNTGVLDITAGPGIAVSGATGHVTVRNTGIIDLVEGEGIDINTNAQGTATIRNSGVVSATSGRGISVQKSGTNLQVTNTGIVDLVEGEGIDINTNGSGTATVRNSGVLSVNGDTGHVTVEPPKAERGVAATFQFTERGQEYSVWIKTSVDTTTFYCYGVKEPDMAYFNVEVICGVEGQQMEVGLYSGTSNTVLTSAMCSTPRQSLDGESIILRAPIGHIADWKMTGVHVFAHPEPGTTGYVRVNRAWLSIRPGSPGDYQV